MAIRPGIHNELEEILIKANAHDELVGSAVTAAVMLFQLQGKIMMEYEPSCKREALLEALGLIQDTIAPTERKAFGKIEHPVIGSQNYWYSPVLGS